MAWVFGINDEKAEKFINDLLTDAVDEFNYIKESERFFDVGEPFTPEEYIRCSLRLGSGVVVGNKVFYPLVLLLPASAADSEKKAKSSVEGELPLFREKQVIVKSYINKTISTFMYKEEGSNKPSFDLFKDMGKIGSISNKKIDVLTSLIVPRIIGDDIDALIELGIDDYPEDYPRYAVGDLSIGVVIDPLRLFSMMLSPAKIPEKRTHVSIGSLTRISAATFGFNVSARYEKR